ncbi:MAG: hypothetical protein H0Z38_04835 [Firmicutes bacterium]|nr:hypothetical protein [Bacillota bacterium]
MHCSPAVAAFFRKKLTGDDWQKLQSILEEVQPFEYHQDEDRFELAEVLEVTGHPLDPEELDLLFHCCQLLNDEAGEKVKRALAKGPVQEEEFTFYYHFTLDTSGATRNTPEVAYAFIKLLQSNPGFRYNVEELPGEVWVEVTISYLSDLEFQRKKDVLDWLIQVARNQSRNSPFKGSTL